MANMLANIFGSSPVRPLEKHMDVVYRCAKKLRPFVNAVIRRDLKRMAEVRGQIEALEHEADNLKKDIRIRMPKSLFSSTATSTPQSRHARVSGNWTSFSRPASRVQK